MDISTGNSDTNKSHEISKKDENQIFFLRFVLGHGNYIRKTLEIDHHKCSVFRTCHGFSRLNYVWTCQCLIFLLISILNIMLYLFRQQSWEPNSIQRELRRLRSAASRAGHAPSCWRSQRSSLPGRPTHRTLIGKSFIGHITCT